MKINSLSNYKAVLKNRDEAVWFTWLSSRGQILIGMYQDRLCYAAFTSNQSLASDLLTMYEKMDEFDWKEKEPESQITGECVPIKNESQINCYVKGTAFQQRVWQALLMIKEGETLSYEGLAERLGSKKLTRAVASAVAKNNLAYFIPCHRVISKNGASHKYRWGSAVKKHLLAFEQGRVNTIDDEDDATQD